MKYQSAFVAVALILAVGMTLLVPGPVEAIPTLQLYIEGSTYDPSTESWTFVGDDFRLWVLGDVGSYGLISGVKLTAAFSEGLTGTITLNPALATPGLLPVPGDPSLPPIPSLISSPTSALTPSSPCDNNGTVGTIPCMGNGRVLPTHAEYGSGVQWVEFLLGDFTLTDSPIGDYISSPPTVFPSLGQINAYDVHVSGFPSSTEIHFDAFDHIVQKEGKEKYVFAPFSHDVLDSPAPVPEPSTLLLLGGGLLGLSVFGHAWRRR